MTVFNPSGYRWQPHVMRDKGTARRAFTAFGFHYLALKEGISGIFFGVVLKINGLIFKLCSGFRVEDIDIFQVISQILPFIGT